MERRNDDYYNRTRIDGKPAQLADVIPDVHQFDQLYFVGLVCYTEFSTRQVETSA